MAKAAPLKILIVDDHAAMRRTVRQLFDEQDVTFLEAATGEEAAQRFATEHPDWVVMDLRMPGMGGLKATAAIRQLDPQARVVIISQFHHPETAEQARQAGAVEFVNKEDLHQLPQIIRQSLAQL